MLSVMEQKDRLTATRLRIGREQRAQLAQQGIGSGQRVSRGAGGAGGRALATTSADMLVDNDVIAIRCDRAGRAEIEAPPAAHDAGARMRAQISGEVHVARLVEGAGQVA